MTRVASAALFALAVCGALPRVAAQGTAAIQGRVTFRGPAQGNTVIRMGRDPKCSQLNAGKQVLQESAVVGRDGAVANVFVRLEGTFAPVPVPSDPVVINQKGCIYGPRVAGVRVGQKLRLVNSDPLLHNVHSSSAAGNSFNTAEPMAGQSYEFTPKAEELMLKLGCDIHTWMTAYVGVVSHPYFAVTAAAGTFEIPRVPPGTYTLHAWHERFGELKKPVTVKAGASVTADFQFAAAAAR